MFSGILRLPRIRKHCRMLAYQFAADLDELEQIQFKDLLVKMAHYRA